LPDAAVPEESDANGRGRRTNGERRGCLDFDYRHTSSFRDGGLFEKTDAARRTHGTGRRVRESHARQMPFVSVMTVKNEVYC
jgi:hypothetical protein